MANQLTQRCPDCGQAFTRKRSGALCCDECKIVRLKNDALEQNVMSLFRESAVTISKCDSEVKIACDSNGDATVLFKWLTALPLKT